MPQSNKLTADSWHDSLPFAMPQRHRNHNRNHSNNPKRFSMSDSTIYKRNEARLLQNQPAINEDPRPKAIRILSLLPGLNMIVPPYDPQLHGTRRGGAAAKNETPPPQELFDHALFPDANIILFGGAARSDSGNNTQRNHGLSLMPSIAIAGFSAASAQVLFHRGPVAPTSSPFARTTNSTMMTSQSPSCYHHHSSPSSPTTTASISLTSTGDLNLTKHRVAATTTSGAAPSTTMTVSTPQQRPSRVTTAARFQKNIPQHHIPSILQAASGLALPFVVREQLGGGGLASNVLAAFCSGCVQTYVPLFSQPAATATTMTTTTLSSLRTVITSPPLFSLSSLSSPLLLGTHMMLAVTSLTLYDAAAPHGIVASTVAGVTAGAIMAVVRQQPPSLVPRSAMRHGTFFAIYRSLYHTVLPPPNDCYSDIHAA
jgi:hypothetical protein